MDLNPSQRGYREDRLKNLYKSIDRLKELRDNIEKDDAKHGLPNIPMGKNSHTKIKDGYIYNKTKIMVQDAVKESLPVNLLHERVQSMWNSLPDDVRDSVNRLLIKKSTAKKRGTTFQGGRWEDKTRTIYMNLSERDQSVEHNFYHEVGHARWNNLKQNNPEKIQKFIERQKEIGWAPTAYSQSYSTIKQRNESNESNYRRKMKRDGFIIPKKAEEILEKNRINSEDLYQNEIHSELNAIAMGSLPVTKITAPKKQIGELLNSYKEMWDLE